MIKRLLILSFIIFGALNLHAQNYGNEWINYSQKYYRISIPSTGLYRINYTTLINAGIPLGSINPKNFQLFCKGEEQYINIVDESDNVFNPTDYIEFYAKKNDASFDSLAYTSTSIPNPYYALFNDTNYVFLTWNNSTNNKRMLIETDVNFSSYTAANYIYSEKIEAYNNNYSLGEEFVGDAISDPRYVIGEGYGKFISKGNSIQTNFGNLNVYQSPSLPVYIRSSFSGASIDYITGISYDHEIKIDYLDNSNNVVNINDTTFFGISQLLVNKQITSNLLQNNSHLKVTSENNPLITVNNKTNVHYLYLKYPQIPDFLNSSEQRFFVDNSSNLKTFLDIQNVNLGSSQAILYDLTNHKYITTVASGNNVKALIPNSASQKECFLTTTSNIKAINVLTAVNQTGFFTNYLTTNSDSAFVIITHKSLQASANDYKTYRQSADGGSNHVIMADIDDLYDQFAYGNIKNPLAIKNFCRFLSDNLPVPPKYLLLIGKSIKGTVLRGTPSYWPLCKVPTIGTPPADNLLTSNIHGSNSATPFIPVGRISANNDNDVYHYLNKVKSHELGLKQIPPDDWHKRVLHFSGGSDIYQQNTFKQYLKVFGDIIKDTLFGGQTFSFQKNSTAPIQIVVSDSVTELINYGASIITFFGHGSVTGFDQAIDDPNAYNNKDKYPLFIANSCYSGDIHLPGSSSTSENFTLIDEKGSIGFIASSSSGLVSALYYYTDQMYKSLAYETYFGGVGDAIKNTSNKTFYLNRLQQITNLEMTLEGDPSVKINAFEKPDYVIKNSYVSIDPNTYVDSIGINIRIRNNGKAIRDTFIVRTERYYPNGDSITFYRKVRAPLNEDTVRFFILKDFENGVGLNHFRVKIDDFNEISELAENNNSTTGDIDLFISGGDVIPVYPYKYAIIPNTSQVTLKASTADPFAPSANYKIQLDTNDTFINPINSTIVTSVGGVIEWPINLPFGDSTVYFWRISKDSVLVTDKTNWRESSFQVIAGKNGWEQAHFHQFKNDKYQFVNYNRPQRKFNFQNNTISVSCRNEYKSNDLYGIQYSINTTVESNYNFNLNDGWSIAVFDSISGSALTSSVTTPGFALPYNNCLAFAYENRASFDFGPNSYCGANLNWQSDLQNFLDSVPVNNYILAYSSNNHHSSTFGPALLQEFKNFGGYSVSTAGDSLPMIVFGKKRNIPFVGCGQEVIGASPTSKIVLNDSIITKWDNGYIESEIIGPANKWNSLHWKYTSQSSSDTVALKIIRINNNGLTDTVNTVFYKDSSDVLDLYNYIDATTYPKIKLIAFMKDNALHIAPQLKKWQVMFDPVPECAINPQAGFSNNASVQAIQEGDNLIVRIPIENIGDVPFNDSLLITYWIEDANRVTHALPQKLKAKPFNPGQIIIDTIKFNSHYYVGFNYLWIDVNTENNSRHQFEQYHFNNVARIGFNVDRDNVNPLLDVTFDGTHILNGDIVSSKPYVLISLKDENKFLALNDTSNFKVFIKYPNQSSEKRIPFNNNLLFTPAQLPNNSCKIEWKPEFAEDGKYTLIVQATDRSDNASGAVDYSIQFEIINKQTVTEVLNYPNPFSTSTRFVFTLTGSEIPDVFTIQIMTISGKVVKEITKSELGNLHIGRNITDYAWDGKDEFGDKLANGVYLYKVNTRSNGKAVDKNATDADSFFKKGVGKLVIIR
ncbi:MAG TPA: C25 family cysteine peptidase [Bacteroidia bacterium]|nr:C25 family cysteine peptidase [Bacteroidia bacterium]